MRMAEEESMRGKKQGNETRGANMKEDEKRIS